MATRKNASPKATAAKAVPLSRVVATVAERKGIETTKAGKQVRSYLRAHFDDVSKRFNYPDGKENRDGNRWPDMPAALAKEIITR